MLMTQMNIDAGMRGSTPGGREDLRQERGYEHEVLSRSHEGVPESQLHYIWAFSALLRETWTDAYLRGARRDP